LLNAGHLVADAGVDSDFFFQFPPEAVARLLARFRSCRRETPLQGHRLVLGALADQELAFAEDERSATTCRTRPVTSRIETYLTVRDSLARAWDACRRPEAVLR